MLALPSPAAPARSSLCVFRPAWETEGWEPARTALPGELVPVITSEGGPSGCGAEGFFSNFPSAWLMEAWMYFFTFRFLSLTPSAHPCE